MEHRLDKWGYLRLGSLILLGIAYGVIRVSLRDLAGWDMPCGTAGVLLGLFICSQPAASLVDGILFGRFTSRPASPAATLLWAAANGLVAVVGWLVIVAGVIQVTRRP